MRELNTKEIQIVSGGSFNLETFDLAGFDIGALNVQGPGITGASLGIGMGSIPLISSPAPVPMMVPFNGVTRRDYDDS